MDHALTVSPPRDLRHGLSRSEIERIDTLHDLLAYRDGHLHFDGLDVAAYCAQTTPPEMIYSGRRLRNNLNALEAGWVAAGRTPRLFFAMKCCYLGPVLEHVRACGHGVEAMSDIELQLALTAGFSRERIVVGGTAKTPAYLKRAADLHPAMIVVDSLQEAEQMAGLTAGNGAVQNIAVRIVPAPEGVDTAFIAPDGKLGLRSDSAEFDAVIDTVRRTPGLRIAGLHAHMVSHCNEPDDYYRMVSAFADCALQIMQTYDLELDILDIGGGLDTHFLLARKGHCAADFAAAGARALRDIDPAIHIWMEPGRFVAADAALGLGKVVSIKTKSDRKWAISDLASNILIPLPDIGYPPLPLRFQGEPWRTFEIADATCAPSHVCRDCSLPDLQPGDVLAFLNVGAYTSVFAELWSFALPSIRMREEDGRMREIFGATQQAAMYRSLYGAEIDI